MTPDQGMEFRRHKDIFALRRPGQAAVAFHGRDLEVAEVSDELWNQLSEVSLKEARPIQDFPSNPSTLNDGSLEARQQIEEWENQKYSEAKPEAVVKGIRSLTINVTQICNLHCTYCAAGGDGTYGDPLKRISIEKTLPQIEFFMNRLAPGEKFHISFLGGEPFLYPESIEMIGQYAREMAQKKSLEVSFKVTTNGTLITPRILAILKSLKAGVVVSLDGPPEINDRVRPQKNRQPITEKIVEGIKLLGSARDELAFLAVHAVFHRDNLEIEKAWEYFQKLPVDWAEFTLAIDGSTPDADEINQKFMAGLENIAARAWALGGEKELRRISHFDNDFRRLDEQQRIENHCGLGKTLLIVDARNDLYNCPWTVGRRKDRMGQGLDLDEKQFQNYAESFIEKNQCGSCWARYLCGGGCLFIHESKTGSKHLKDAHFCERTRFLISLSILYYKKSRETSELLN